MRQNRYCSRCWYAKFGKRYRASAKGQAAFRRYRVSERNKVTQARYRRTEKGRAAVRSKTARALKVRGHSYGTAKTAAQARVLRAYIRQRLDEFMSQRREEAA